MWHQLTFLHLDYLRHMRHLRKPEVRFSDFCTGSVTTFMTKLGLNLKVYSFITVCYCYLLTMNRFLKNTFETFSLWLSIESTSFFFLFFFFFFAHYVSKVHFLVQSVVTVLFDVIHFAVRTFLQKIPFKSTKCIFP